MKVQTRLTLFSSLVFGAVFIVVAFLIYGLYYTNTKQSIYNNLRTTSLVIAFFNFEEDELNKEEFAPIEEKYNNLPINSIYQVYDENNRILLGDKGISLTVEKLAYIREKQNLAFVDRGFFCYAIYYRDNQGDFVIVSHERTEVLTDQMQQLLWVLLWAFVIGMLSLILMSRWMARLAYRPFSDIIKQVNNISTNNLNVQIASPETKDELEDLVKTFNALLSKISETVLIQKNFVQYVSHEFKTPLTSMLGNLEVFSIKDRSPEEYREVSEKLIQQIIQLEDLLNTLIVISDLRKETEITQQTRVDEVIWQITESISKSYSSARLMVNLNLGLEDEALLTVTIDRTQLLLALFNLIENAVKYSKGSDVEITLEKVGEQLSLSISDKGIGIPEEHLKDISKPFYRAENTNQIQGSGIGLSIALRVLEKNNITYRIDSKQNEGTTVVVVF